MIRIFIITFEYSLDLDGFFNTTRFQKGAFIPH